jgi:predicted transposase/invertase (TIGR01784 family)
MPGPHDLFARYTFGHPERAAAELHAVLPPHVVSAVDWSSLRREPGSVVDPELREPQSDLLFSARLRSGHPLLLYVLLEHQSSVDRWMALRMLRYVVRQVERWRQEHPDSTWWSSSATSSGLAARRSTKPRGGCYIPSWMLNERRR